MNREVAFGSRLIVDAIGPGGCPRCINYERARRVVEHEDHLINHRLTWLFVGEGFLFAAFGLIQQERGQLTLSPSRTSSATIGKAVGVADQMPWRGLASIVCLVGFGAALIVLLGILGAFNAMHQGHQRWWELTRGDPPHGRHECGHDNWFERLQGRGVSLGLGALPAFGFPIGLAIAWAALFVLDLDLDLWRVGDSKIWSLIVAGLLAVVWAVPAFGFARQAQLLGELARFGCTKAGWLHPLRARWSLETHRSLAHEYFRKKEELDCMRKQGEDEPDRKEHFGATYFMHVAHHRAAEREAGLDLEPDFCPLFDPNENKRVPAALVDVAVSDCCAKPAARRCRPSALCRRR